MRQSHGAAWHAFSSEVDAISGAAIDAGPYIGRMWKEGMPNEYNINGQVLVVSLENSVYTDLMNPNLKTQFFNELYGNTTLLNRNYRFHPVNVDMSSSMGIMTAWSYFVLDAPLIWKGTIENAESGYQNAYNLNRIRYQTRLLKYYREHNIIK